MVLINLLWTNILKNALYFSVNVFSTLFCGQVLNKDTIFEDTIFTFPTGFGTTTLRCLLSNMKV